MKACSRSARSPLCSLPTSIPDVYTECRGARGSFFSHRRRRHINTRSFWYTIVPRCDATSLLLLSRCLARKRAQTDGLSKRRKNLSILCLNMREERATRCEITIRCVSSLTSCKKRSMKPRENSTTETKEAVVR